ncbi:MAG TPA: putative nucleotidyltransferase substrate binding domain-containing protein [Phycicoccus elongatus]|nr:putative nucleotidyltransferase substrate binding domain-containing protein [Phycicoccus elongatus]
MALDVELAEIRDFLARHAPFDTLPPDVLAELPRRMTVEYYRRGRTIITRSKDNHSLFVLRSGAVDIHDDQGTLVDRGEAGDVFGSITLVLGNPSTFDVTAIEDCLVYVLPEAEFRALTAAHPDVAHFFDEQRAHRMRGAVAKLQDSGSTSAMLKTGVRDLITRAPITIAQGATITEAARTMKEHGASSLLVMDGEALAGIVTDRDLRNRVLAVGLGADRPVQEVMTAGPVVGDADALAFEVLLEMVGRNIHHLPILEHDRPIGVVTTTDLMRMVQASPVYVVGDIQKQSDVEGVATVSARLPAVVEALVGQDASADDIGRVVTAIGDAVERRLITLAEAELGGPPVPYTWVALGSRARLEQALAADQDNAIIISDEATDADLAWFEELARRVSAGLVECGYPTCPGDVMATNPRWRLRLQDWRQEFATWLTQPVPDAILQASIFFDMRPVHGDSGLFPELHHGILARAPQSRLFLAHLAKAATLNEPPLGFFRGFVLAKEGEHADTLDIKRGGIGAVVELARVHALALGSPAVNTVARLQAAIAGGIMSEEKGADLTDAFEFISYVRLRHQAAQVREGRPVDNHVNPDQLSSFDKRHLREAFAIVRSAQSAMASRYPTTFM